MTRKEEYLQKLDELNEEYKDVFVDLPKVITGDFDSASPDDLHYTMARFLNDITKSTKITGPNVQITDIKFGYWLENSETERVVTVRGDYGTGIVESRDIFKFNPESDEDLKNILSNWTVVTGR